MLEVKDLTKKFENEKAPIIENLSYTFKDNGLYHIVGKSGCGKTTLLLLLGGIDTDYEGSIRFDGEEISMMSKERKEDYRFEISSFVFQDFKADEEENVLENLLKSLDLLNLSKNEKIKKIQDGLIKVGLSGFEERRFESLSGGEKKRISLVRGLLIEKPILLVDEPTSSLDPTSKAEINRILVEESKKRLVIVITHDIEEIPTESTVLEFESRTINEIRNREINNVQHLSKTKRGKYHLVDKVRSILSFAKCHHRLLYVLLFSMSVSIFSITFSMQLYFDISSSLISTFSQYMDEESLVIENNEQGTILEGEVSNQILSYVENKYADMVLSSEIFYIDSLDEIFSGRQTFTFTYGNKSVVAEKISADSFLEHSISTEYDIESTEDFELDEISIILGKEQYKSLFYLMKGYIPDLSDETAVDLLNKELSWKSVALRMQVRKPEWSYSLDYSFPIRKAYVSDRSAIINDNRDFSTNFVEEILHFKSVSQGEEKEKPWTLSTCPGFRLRKEKTVSLLMSFLRDKRLDDFTLEVLKRNDEEENHYVIKKDTLPKLSVSSIEEFRKQHSDILCEPSYSSYVYTYTANGFVSGFNIPFFFSKYKEKLNRIEDENSVSNQDLGQFQATLFDVEEGIFKSDLSSSINGKGVSFKPKENGKLIYGKEPSLDDEIGISMSFAKKLFNNPSDSLETSLSLLFLKETREISESYRNEFIDGELRIVGIYEDDSDSIYQDSLFPLAYVHSKASLKNDYYRVTDAVIKINDVKYDSETLLLQLENDYGLKGSFPMKTVIAEIRNTLSLLTKVFLSLSVLSILTSLFLIIFSFSLILKRKRKSIGILLSVGYRTKEITGYYLLMISILATSSLLSSLILSSVTEKILSDALDFSLSEHSTTSAIPYLISIGLTIFFILVSYVQSALNIRKADPLDCLR